ncbi:hypothetical protein [Thermosipho atlanticus]|uniref:Alpha-galactosidase N-terminal domain-containing protein n=1 Tax=Thermosipho atlanticus DSM 15807 TaxID=1123380 RepID=A0A1M5QUB6_9BACT|nr:hypothetical protein [Thermosipho atlanticus]SHH17548.1 hypothetical protein SAMN02745199_0144 [Thermosipho atlanticus DSM 15807]
MLNVSGVFNDGILEEKFNNFSLRWQVEKIRFGWKIKSYVKGEPKEFELLRLNLKKDIVMKGDLVSFKRNGFIIIDNILYGFLTTLNGNLKILVEDDSLIFKVNYAHKEFDDYVPVGSFVILKIANKIDLYKKYVELVMEENNIHLKKIKPIILKGIDFLSMSKLLHYLKKKGFNIFFVYDEYSKYDLEEIYKEDLIKTSKMKRLREEEINPGIKISFDSKNVSKAALKKLFTYFSKKGVKLVDIGEERNIKVFKLLKEIKKDFKDLILLSENSPFLHSVGVVDIVEKRFDENYLFSFLEHKKIWYVADNYLIDDTFSKNTLYGVLNKTLILNYNEKICETKLIKDLENVLLEQEYFKIVSVGEDKFEIRSYSETRGLINLQIDQSMKSEKFIKEEKTNLRKKIEIRRDGRKFYFFGGDDI